VAVETFEKHRDHLMAVAYRMLGSRADAEDAVQEAWLRWDANRDGVRDARGWLTTVTARICLDELRSARVRRESYVGPWLPEPMVEPMDDPAAQVARADQIGYALLVVLERLSPEQRVAFVLHDVFAVPFDEIAPVLATTPAAARQLASRARRLVRGRRAEDPDDAEDTAGGVGLGGRAVTAEGVPRHTADLAEQRRVVTAFLDAAQHGDLDGLLRVLAPDVVTVGDGGGVAPAGRQPVVGAVPVARFLLGLFRRYASDPDRIRMEPVMLNGELGLYAELELPDGSRLRGTMAFAVADGRLTGIYSQVNPAKLRRVPRSTP
jgi:RNA polymerase sigma-70 factor, ECF subfamily